MSCLNCLRFRSTGETFFLLFFIRKRDKESTVECGTNHHWLRAAGIGVPLQESIKIFIKVLPHRWSHLMRHDLRYTLYAIFAYLSQVTNQPLNRTSNHSIFTVNFPAPMTHHVWRTRASSRKEVITTLSAVPLFFSLAATWSERLPRIVSTTVAPLKAQGHHSKPRHHTQGTVYRGGEIEGVGALLPSFTGLARRA